MDAKLTTKDIALFLIFHIKTIRTDVSLELHKLSFQKYAFQFFIKRLFLSQVLSFNKKHWVIRFQSYNVVLA